MIGNIKQSLKKISVYADFFRVMTLNYFTLYEFTVLNIFLLIVTLSLISLINQVNRLCLRLPFTSSGVFSFSYVTSLIRIGYPQTYLSMESL